MKIKRQTDGYFLNPGNLLPGKIPIYGMLACWLRWRDMEKSGPNRFSIKGGTISLILRRKSCKIKINA